MIWQITKNLFKHHKEIWARQALSIFGSIFILDEVMEKLGVFSGDKVLHNYFILGLFAVCVLVGMIYTVRRIVNYTIDLPSEGKVQIEFGDLFDADTDYVLIPTNDFFDCDMGDTAAALVSHRSILGQYIVKSGKEQSIQEEIAAQLQDSQLSLQDSQGSQSHFEVDDARQQAGLPHKKYKYGKTLLLEETDTFPMKAALVASSYTSFENGKAFSNSTIPIVAEAICACLDTIPEKQSIAIPLLGSGYSRINLDTNQLLQILIGCVIERSQKLRKSATVKIILQPKFKGELPLYYLDKEWELKK